MDRLSDGQELLRLKPPRVGSKATVKPCLQLGRGRGEPTSQEMHPTLIIKYFMSDFTET